MWYKYNTELQTYKSDKIKEEDPCSNPEGFLAITMNNCLDANKTKWDKQTATNKCSMQVDKLRQAIDNHCK